jgi:GNAT superfamily N-acetyltransferase
MSVTVTPVSGRRDIDAFIKLPFRLYRDDPNWVPPLLYLERQRFSAKTNPFLQHADHQLFLAHRDGQVVGRISAQVDHEHNRFHQERTGFFGFFESEDDGEVAQLLLETAEGWLRERGMEAARGPLSFSINQEVGLLVDGFDTQPMIMMAHSRPYYGRLIEGAGFSKVMDLYAWKYNLETVPPKAHRAVETLRQRPEITVRTGDIHRFDEEIATILDTFNSAWSKNWGFVPVTPAEARHLAKELRTIVDPNLAVIVEVDGKTAGVVLVVPDLNEAIRDLNGRLFPFGWAKLLWRIKVSKIKSGRLMIMGVKKEYRTRKYLAMAYLLCDEIYYRARDGGYRRAEFSWTLEVNTAVNTIIRNIGIGLYKTYRLYEKPLSP